MLDGDASLAYALVRPPGHHASSRTADGYCFFNNTALAAENARRRGKQRVAILDWDVHHGNGTQTLFYERDDVLTVSWHMAHGSWGASHPETGAPTETGNGGGTGYNVNVELPLGSGDHAYLHDLRPDRGADRRRSSRTPSSSPPARTRTSTTRTAASA